MPNKFQRGDKIVITRGVHDFAFGTTDHMLGMQRDRTPLMFLEYPHPNPFNTAYQVCLVTSPDESEIIYQFVDSELDMLEPMSNINLHGFTHIELLRYVDRSHPEIDELAQRLDTVLTDLKHIHRYADLHTPPETGE